MLEGKKILGKKKEEEEEEEERNPSMTTLLSDSWEGVPVIPCKKQNKTKLNKKTNLPSVPVGVVGVCPDFGPGQTITMALL